MNSTIFVQQNIGIPAGPLNPSDTPAVAPDVPTKTAEKKSVGAIIRPRPVESGKQGSVRLDPVASHPPQQHVRNHDLDDYVNWLREKIKRDQQDMRHSVSAVQSDDNGIEQKTTGPLTQTTLDVSLPMRPQPKPASGHPVNNIHRVDQRHDGISEAYLKFDELRTLHENAAVSVVETSSGVSTNNQETTNAPSKVDSDSMVAEISKAIASVLTDTPEQVIERKLQTNVEPALHSSTNANENIEARETPGVRADRLDRTNLSELVHSGGNPVMAMISEAEKITSEIMNTSRKDIPTSVAAWDVEDFRWPVVTNRMIVSGGESLDHLSRSVFDMVSPANHRLAVAGLGRGEGTTSVAISLARWSVASGKKVLLVDADLVAPNLTKQVGLAPNISWINAVSQSLPPAEVIVRSQQSNLCIMPLAEMVSRVTWPRFIYDNLGEVIEQVRNHFDLIVIDVGPANQLLAELSRSPLLVDATLMVHNGVDSAEFQKTKNRLELFGIHKMIVAENRARKASVNVA